MFLKSQKKFVGFRPRNIFDEFYPDPKTFSLQGLEYGTQATVAKKCGSRPETDCHSKTLTIFPSYTTTPLIICNKGKRTTMNRFCAQVRAIHSCRPQLVICFSLSLSLFLFLAKFSVQNWLFFQNFDLDASENVSTDIFLPNWSQKNIKVALLPSQARIRQKWTKKKWW